MVFFFYKRHGLYEISEKETKQLKKTFVGLYIDFRLRQNLKIQSDILV